MTSNFSRTPPLPLSPCTIALPHYRTIALSPATSATETFLPTNGSVVGRVFRILYPVSCILYSYPTIAQLLVSLVLFDYFCLLSNKYILHWLSVRLCYFLHPNSTHLPVYPFHLHISIRRIHQILVLLFCRLNL